MATKTDVDQAIEDGVDTLAELVIWMKSKRRMKC